MHPLAALIDAPSGGFNSKNDMMDSVEATGASPQYNLHHNATSPQRDLHHNATTPQRDIPTFFGYPPNTFSTSFSIGPFCRADLEQPRTHEKKTLHSSKAGHRKPYIVKSRIQKCCHIKK